MRRSTTISYNVLNFGAKRNGVMDSTQAFLDAWSAAYGSSADSSEINVPKGRYLLGSMAFKGDYKYKYVGALVLKRVH
jgi:polygalacturonase